MTGYPKRLIEVDLPIKRISAHSRREKSIRHGHISTLHIWWARRPLAACRAVICAALWPDPADEHCPLAFRGAARRAMLDWARDHIGLASTESFSRLNAIRNDATRLDDALELRGALLDFIADFANWDNSTVKAYLDTSRALTQVAHEAMGGVPGTRPLVVDPFAGGGAFPIEAARLETASYAGDYNILSWTINRLQLELLPRCNGKLADLTRLWSERFLSKATQRLSRYYPIDPDGKHVVGYLWARTIKCEGPGCGVDVPIMKTTHLTSKGGREKWVEVSYEHGDLKTRIISTRPSVLGTSKRSSVTCPKCGYTTPQARVATQATSQGFGYHLYAIGVRMEGDKTTVYRDPADRDRIPLNHAHNRLLELEEDDNRCNSCLIPSEELPYLRSIFNVRVYGIDKWRGLFTERQLVSALELVSLFQDLSRQINAETEDIYVRQALTLSLGLSLSNAIQYQCNIATWLSESVKSAFIQGQSLPMKMDFVEANPLFQGLAGGLAYSFNKHHSGIEYLESYKYIAGETHLISAATPFAARARIFHFYAVHMIHGPHRPSGYRSALL
jgi:putative DNA methylase